MTGAPEAAPASPAAEAAAEAQAPAAAPAAAAPAAPAAAAAAPTSGADGAARGEPEKAAVKPAAEAEAAKAESEAAAGGEENELYPEGEEVVEGDWARPAVEVSEVEVKSGEEDEEVHWSHRAKLYRFTAGEWKERGIGEAKLLRHKASRKIRFLLRQEKTQNLIANHYVLKVGQLCSLVPNSGNEKIWVWTANDFAEGAAQREMFGLKFGKLEDAAEFKKKFDEAADSNAALRKADAIEK